MIENTIEKLFAQKGLGAVVPPVTPVSGGFLHRMFKVDTENGSFAVKRLNPNIMKRPEAMGNYSRAEALERILEDAGIPIVPAVTTDGCKMQECDGEHFYIFRWHDGKTADWCHITAEQCCLAGNIQGRMHAIAPRQIEKAKPESSNIDWGGYIGEAFRQNAEIGALLQENERLLVHAQREMNSARAALPGLECIVDEDMDPKNVLWEAGKPLVIDLECLTRGNPVSSAVQLSLQWAGAIPCDLDFDKLKAFFDGYHAAYDNGFRDYGAVFGLAYTWIEWLEYNIKRALGECVDEAERQMGVSEVKNTVARIRYIHDMEARIKGHLSQWFEMENKTS